jgi:hypothetical protein
MLEGILQDVVISIDYWVYPTNFMMLQPNSNLGGYPLILGKPWLATIDAYIRCRSSNMTISHRNYTKKLTLYSLTKPSVDQEMSIWVENEYRNDEIM